jgi:uncharacterized membrane protein
MTASSTKRRRQLPWLHRHGRTVIAGIAGTGLVLTSYLTVVKLTGAKAACPTEGCDRVLNSPYAEVLGIPLPLIGMLGYAAMLLLALAPLATQQARKDLQVQIEEWSGLLLVAGGAAMATFSGYLMYVMVSEIRETCLYCLGSAFFYLSLFGLALSSRRWDDLGKPIFTAIGLAIITLVGTLGVYATPSGSSSNGSEMFTIKTNSGPAEIALAEHLTQTGAQEFGAYWCPHCHEQKELFGKEAAAKLPYVECDPNGKNAKPDLCRAAGIRSFPSWKIGGKLYEGVTPLDRLADLSGYQGDRTFRQGSLQELPNRAAPIPEPAPSP